MKRYLMLLLAAAMLASGVCAAAEGYAGLSGTYELASGIGAWYTELHLDEDGGIHGHYQDTDMEPGELDGTPYEIIVYTSDFTGRLSAPKRAGEWELDATIAELRWDAGDPWVEGNTLYVPTSPGGLNPKDRLRIFTEGASVADLPEGFLVWVRMREAGITWQSMPYNGIYNESADSGFSGIGDRADSGITSWEFITVAPAQTPAPAPEPAAESPRADAAESAGESEAAAEGIEYPVWAEVVNCKTGVSLRGQPSTKAPLLAEVPLGALVQVYSNRAYSGNDRWFVDASYNGQRGYICVEYLDIMLPESLRYQREYLRGLGGTVSAVNPGTDLILRAGPGTDREAVGLLFGGEVLGYLGDAKKDAGGMC